MTRVLAIAGSPRRNGNTSILLARVLEGARAAGAPTDEVFLGDLGIRECDGCHACWRGKPCSKRDDMNALYPRVEAADVLVFGTPVYWYGPTALMKAFLDRFVYFNCPENRAHIRGKVVALVVPFEEEDEGAAAPLVALFEKSFRYLELEFAGALLAPGLGPAGAARSKPDLLQRAYDLGRRLTGG